MIGKAQLNFIASAINKEIDKVRKEERERAQKIIEGIFVERLESCDCGDIENCKWTKGHNFVVDMVLLPKKEALKKLNSND